MANLISGFKKIDSEKLLSGSGEGEGALTNDDPYAKPKPNGIGLVDVIRNFSWYSGGSTQMQENAIRKTPQVFLVEREQKLSSLLSQAIYYAQTAKKGVENISLLQKSLNYLTKLDITRTTSLIKALDNAVSNELAKHDKPLLEANELTSLLGIYLTEPTGFKYVLPYFENPPSIQNSWDGTSEENAPDKIGDAVNKLTGVADEVAKTVNLTQPGVFIQKAKSYKVNEQGQSITVKFPLFNTVKRSNDDPYQQNYELLWLLTYQNKPFKTSFTRVRPPKIYSVTVPGMISMPYAEISRLEVSFVGTTRNKTVNIGGKKFQAPIPDAYEVTIELTSLLSDYANTMVGDGFSTTVDTETNTILFGGAIESAINSITSPFTT